MLKSNWRRGILGCFLALWVAASASAVGVTFLSIPANYDFDADGITDPLDNAPGIFNPTQQDDDGDIFGNAGELFAGTATNSPDTDGQGSLDWFDPDPLGAPLNLGAAYNAPYVIDFLPIYSVNIGNSVALPFTHSTAIGAKTNYLRLSFDVLANGPGADFWYISDDSTLTPVLTSAYLAALGLNSPGQYKVNLVGGDLGRSTSDLFEIHVSAVPEGSAVLGLTAVMTLLGATRIGHRRKK